MAIGTVKLWRGTVPYVATVLVTACGGGGSSNPPPVTYGVNTTAGSQGSFSPASATVNAGSTTTFTVTPNSGYVISSVTGCGGSLSGSTYTTGAVSANCTVTASFSAVFTWVSGPMTSDASAVYGTQGVGSTGNTPGGRHGPVVWSDASGNLWLFGGYGVGAPIYNDLWEYSTASGQWTWVSGSNMPDAAGAFGTLGTPASTNTPGGLAASAFSWTDASGNVWLFGGYGYDSAGNRGWLNSVWEYSPTTGMWTWNAGSKTNGALGVYGTEGVAAATNFPSSRAVGGWKDSTGNVWLFGGYGYDSTGALGRLNDLWSYSPSSHEWTWVSGSNTVNVKGVYGTQGTAASTNVPGARSGYATWTDAGGDLWLFGGYGYDSAGTQGSLNDLWKYSPAGGVWTWVAGSNTVNAAGVYGTLGTAAAANLPGARYSTAAWTDSAGNLWMFAGTGYDSAGANNELNDLWKYSPSSNQWTWVAGSNKVNATGAYGTQGVAATANVPGARDGVTALTDGKFVWLFAGEGLNITGADPTAPAWSDLWKYPIQ